MSKTKFYVLEPEEGIMFGRKWVYADQVEPIIRGGPKVCPKCGKPISLLSWLPPHNIQLSSSNPDKYGDFLWGAGFYIMVSDRFVRLYQEAGLRGITYFYSPAQIISARVESETYVMPKYSLIDYKWFGANQDDDASSLVLESPETVYCDYCRLGGKSRKQERIVLELSTWDGSDIFKPRGCPASILVTEGFKSAVEDEGLKNFMFIPSEKYGYDSTRKGLWYINA